MSNKCSILSDYDDNMEGWFIRLNTNSMWFAHADSNLASSSEIRLTAQTAPAIHSGKCFPRLLLVMPPFNCLGRKNGMGINQNKKSTFCWPRWHCSKWLGPIIKLWAKKLQVAVSIIIKTFVQRSIASDLSALFCKHNILVA